MTKTPGSSFVWKRTLNEREHHCILSRAIFERSGKRWHIGKLRALGQESRDLNIGINPLLQFPEDFQKILRAKEDRGIALLPSHDARIRAQILRRREWSGRRANDPPAARPQFS